MEHKNYTLADIIAHENGRQNPVPEARPDTLVLVDMSMMSPFERVGKEGNVIEHSLYEAATFDDIDSHLLKTLTTGFEHLFEAARAGPLKVTPHCYAQFERFRNILRQKKTFLHNHEDSRIDRHGKGGRGNRDTDQARRTFHALTFSVDRAVEKLGRSRYLPEGREERTYEGMMCAIAKCWAPYVKNAVRSLADESLVTAALYRTLIQAKPLAIITGDHDIADLLNRARAHLTLKEMPYARQAAQAFAANTARVYYARNMDLYIAEYDTGEDLMPIKKGRDDATERNSLAQALFKLGVYKTFMQRLREQTATDASDFSVRTGISHYTPK